MTIFLRLLAEEDKAVALHEVCSRQRAEGRDPRVFDVAPEAFDAVPGKPVAYWVTSVVRETFSHLYSLSNRALVTSGTGTLDDFRFLRAWWETNSQGRSTEGRKWFPYAKGGAFAPIYFDHHLSINWNDGGAEMKAWIIVRYGGGHWARNIRSTEHYFRPGLTWPRRTNGLSFRVMPAGCIFADKGPAAFVADDDPEEILALCALLNSRAFGVLVSVQLARTELAQSYEVGLIQQTPIPPLPPPIRQLLGAKARRAWSLKRTLDSVNETSHAFLLPAALLWADGSMQRAEGRMQKVGRGGRPVCPLPPPTAIFEELARIQSEIDRIAFDLYGFSESDRAAMLDAEEITTEDTENTEEEQSRNLSVPSVSSVVNPSSLLSWAVGVSFGRFDWRLATGEREPPPEPDPFDPLPANSPGMLPDGAESFHAHAGILVDDPGHPHDLPRLIESVLERVDVTVPPGVRKWLQRDFFKEHLQQYSKSRRKAPIYWPLATASGTYILWVYYPSLTSQTLYTAVNDFVEPKLKSVPQAVQNLRAKADRSGAEERELERLQDLELELTDLRDTLLAVAPDYKPNHDDGVQITAAPLWPLFRHKPWQKLLKETWQKLEKGDYDWAHLAYNYWPERVRGKCRTDKSLAIAHGLEEFYEEPPEQGRKTRGRKK